MKRQQYLTSTISRILFCLILIACTKTPGEVEFSRAQKEVKNSNSREAIIIFHKITRLYPKEEISLKAAREGFSLCKLEKSCEYYDYFLGLIIANSDDDQEVIKAQTELALYYYDKGMYSSAIQTMNTLLSKSNFKHQKNDVRLKLARSYFYIKSFYQSEVELNAYIKEANTDREKFDGLLVKADILSAQKKFNEASLAYKEIKEKYRDHYIKDQVYISEAFMYEDQKLLDQAIITLEEVQKEVENKEFVSVKIERLKERKALMPGASGLKR